MALESGTYIDSLVATNPTGTDDRSQGDDHLRLIKSTVLNTFPNITGAVTATQAELNLLAGVTSLIPPGLVTMFAGSEAQIPSGWQLCNGSGTTTNGINIPDLRDKFIVGATSTYPINGNGGYLKVSGTVTVDNHTLTVDQIPSHTHVQDDRTALVSPNQAPSSDPTSGSPSGTRGGTTKATGGGQGHNHTASLSTGADSNLPPYYALAYIIKL
jgi:microcystin-dependent protein